MGPIMADGAASFFKRRSMMAYADDADPRFSDSSSEDSKHSDNGKARPRIAFTGEEWGFGYKATDKFLRRARATGSVPDAGYAALGVRLEREFDEASSNNKFDYRREITQPLRTKEQALMAVKQNTADFALVPFYNPFGGYDYEALRAVASLVTVRGIEQVEATDDLCLAVHESQLFDLVQSAHPGSAFSNLMRRHRQSYGPETGSDNKPGASFDSELPRAGLPLDVADQKLIRDRIDVVFAGPEAARRCKSKLDGIRAIGVEVQEIAQMVEPHRELARLARSSMHSNRQTNTVFNPSSGETSFYSTLGADAQDTRLFGMVLPYEVAMRSTDYTIIDHDFDDDTPTNTRFMVVENNPDHSLYEDKYRTTDAKTAYWGKRLHAVAAPGGSIGAGFMQMMGYAGGALAALLIIFGVYGVSGTAASIVELPASLAWMSSLTSMGALAIGGAIALASWILLSVQSAGRRGVRVIMAFRRDSSAAAIGDVENFLRNYGVRHNVVRLDEDSNTGAPADIALDIEFDPADFSYGPFAMISRRLRGPVVNGALKKAFQRWKNRGVRVLAAMPFEPDAKRASEKHMPSAQLPRHAARRWWSEAVGAWFSDVTETWFIRISRIMFFYLVPALGVAYIVWKFVLNG